MSTRSLPVQVNHRKFALEKHKLEGVIPLADFQRLGESLLDTEGLVTLKLEFRKGKKQQPLVVGSAQVVVQMTCQACLTAMPVDLQVSVRHLIVLDEEALLALPEEIDGIVCSEEKIKLVDIFEDELIINLPMVSRHIDGECKDKPELVQETLPQAEQAPADTYRPFADLAKLKDDLTRS